MSGKDGEEVENLNLISGVTGTLGLKTVSVSH